MGIDLGSAFLIEEIVERYQISGSILTYGVPSIQFDKVQFERVSGNKINVDQGRDYFSPKGFFSQLGFSSVSFADVSDYEGADFIFDLGGAGLPSELHQAFDIVFDCGTLEHVFNFPQALENTRRMIKPGGYTMHITVMNNAVEHGFYQFSPTVFFDYYSAAGFEILEAMTLSFCAGAGDGTEYKVRPLRRGTFGGGLLGGLGEETVLILFLTRMRSSVDKAVSPLQYIYSEKKPDIACNPRWFAPFVLRDGCKTEAGAEGKLRLDYIVHNEGLGYYAILPPFVGFGNDINSQNSSNLLLLEDGVPLGPMSWNLSEICEFGGGAYNHWGETLFFSSSDGSDPSANGRVYEALYETRKVPQAIDKGYLRFLRNFKRFLK